VDHRLSWICGARLLDQMVAAVYGRACAKSLAWNPVPPHTGGVRLAAFMRTVLRLAKPYRTRLALGILCGFVAGLTNPLLLGSIKLVFEVVFPQPGAPTLAERFQGFSLLTASDLQDMPQLLNTMRRGADPVSAFIWNQLSPGARLLLADTNATAQEQQPVLVEELNRVLRSPSFYDSTRFSGIPLSGETRARLAESPTGLRRSQLHLLLLRDAFPQAIKRKRSQGLTRFFAPLLDVLKPRVERLGRDRPGWLVVLVISTIPLAMLLRGLFTYLNIYLMNWVAVRGVADLRSKLFNHLMALSASFFNRVSTGELMSRLTEVNGLHQTISQAMVVIIKEPVTLAGLTGWLLVQEPSLTAVALLVFPLTLIPFVIYARKVRKSSVAIYQKYADMGRMMHENFTGFRIVKAYNLEDKVIAEFDRTSRAAVSHYMRILRSMEIPGPLMEFFGAIGVAAFFVYVALFSRTTPGGLIAFVGGIFLMYQPIKSLIRLHNQLQQAEAATQYAFGVLATESSIPEPAKPLPLRAEHADIQFKRVGFSYGDKPALGDIDLTIRAGQMVALVGSSGSGKTTLTNLLLRFYDPLEGAICIGGVDIRDVALADLRRQIAIVTQETILFNDTIANNISLGRPGAGEDEIVAAAKHAHAHEFIRQKPQGYNTMVGEKGSALSGGQRQRLAIARAILKNAPILILDEATSSLDSESERAIQSALDELMRRRTTLCIAHRLSTIQNADLIVVLHEGRIVETGRHAQLLALDGIYRKLSELQFQGAQGRLPRRGE
jgi:ATP-binding cassette, subfamily B, bacterial MsbA